MASSMPPFGATLPRQWPRRVRSAIVHAISMAQVSLTTTRSWAANHFNARVRLRAENERLRQEVGLLQEEIRIKDNRMLRVPAQQRPHYPPMERLAILELRAARGWSLTQTARHLLVATATVASWMHRLNEEGPGAIVQTRTPVNKFPDFVAYLVQRLKGLCPTLGKTKIAQFLGRAGLHLSTTTVRRMLLQKAPPKPSSPADAKAVIKTVTARRPNHTWHSDLSTVPTALGFWTSWLPFALPQCWPFCWWVAVVVDHYSRKIMGFAVFKQQPRALAVWTLLGRIARQAGCVPRYLITDQGSHFTDDGFRHRCRRRAIQQRFGAVGHYGSIAVIERLIRTIKSECTRRLLVPYAQRSLRTELSLFITWWRRIVPASTETCAHALESGPLIRLEPERTRRFPR